MSCEFDHRSDFMLFNEPSDGIIPFYLSAGDTLYVPDLKIYVARGNNRHGCSISEKAIRSFFEGWGANSINPLMLQLGITFEVANIEIHNIELPLNDHNNDGGYYNYNHFNSSMGPGIIDPKEFIFSYYETDESGHRTGNLVKLDNSCIRILIMEKGPEGGESNGAPGNAVALNVHGTTRNLVAHELGHVFGLNHPNDNSGGCFTDSDEGHKWNMRSVINDSSVNFSVCQAKKAKRTVENYFLNNNNEVLRKAYRKQFHKIQIGSSRLTLQTVNKAWNLLHSDEYKDANCFLSDLHI